MAVAKPMPPTRKKVRGEKVVTDTRRVARKTILSADVYKKEQFSLQDWLTKLFFTAQEQQGLLEDMATLVDDGVPANKAVEVISQIETGSKKAVMESMKQAIAEGKPIADGMRGWFSQATVELVRAGEQGGTLAKNIRSAAEALGTKTETFSSLASSLTYPLVVIIAGCCVLIYLNNSVFTQFAAIKPIAQWPENGQKLVALADFLQNWWWMILLSIGGVIGFITYLLTNLVGESRKLVDSIPGATIYRQLMAARFMETMGLLISNGIVFKQSLKILQNRANPYLAWHLMMMEFRLGRGRSNIAEVLDTGLVSSEDVLRLRAIADAKGFEHALIRLGKFSAAEATKTVRTVGKVLGGVFLAVAALFAAFMVTGLYSVGSSLS